MSYQKINKSGNFFFSQDELSKIKEISIIAFSMIVMFAFFFIVPKNYLVIAVNKYHSTFFNIFSKILEFSASFLGYGFFLGSIIFFRRNFFETIFSLISFFIASSITKLIKNIFSFLARPHACIDHSLLQGSFFEDLEKTMSFPSGHSSTAFVITFTSMFIFFKTKSKKKLIVLVFGILVALSRVYLAVHFFRDVYFGMIIGILGVIISRLFCCSVFGFKKFLRINDYKINIK